MKESSLFAKTQKTIPQDERSLNAQLLLRAGFIYKEMAGVYTFLPLGLRVVQKITAIIKEEMDKVGGIEIQTTALQKKEPWEATGRWSDKIVDNWFKTKLKNGTEVGLGFTQEEAITDMMRSFISSYKDLPVYVYDIRTVFRNEKRAKSGLLRGREFFWKALYSFSLNKDEHDVFYEKVKKAYLDIFQKVGIGKQTYLTFASGGTFSKYSHEFQTITEAGEDTIFIDKKKNIALNKEVYNEKVLNDLGLNKKDLVEEKGIEVGNIFSLGERYSRALNLTYLDKEGHSHYVFMGSYGIGISRLMGTIVEVNHDEKGIIWPENVAPFQFHLLSFGKDKEAESVYKYLLKNKKEVLFDDREKSAGEKLADSDLCGIPWRIIVSEKSLQKGGVEIKKRGQKETKVIKKENILKYV